MRIILLILIIALTGCSTIASKTQQFSVTTTPEDAAIVINGQQMGKGHAVAQVKRDSSVSVMVSKKGCQPMHRAIGHSINGLGILDGVGTLLFLVPAVGLASAGAYSLDEDTVHFTLMCDPPTSTSKAKLKQTPRKKIDPNKVVSASSGSGFAVSSNGYVVTNNHVINGCQNVKIHYKGGAIPATVVAYDPENDLALLKGDFRPSTILPLSNDAPELLQDIYVAGYPFGRSISAGVKVTKGIISSLTGIGNNFSEIQIDAALQPGNSGGPILDDKGNVVGVAVSKLDREFALKKYGTLPENTNFGIKTSVVRNILVSSGVSLPSANPSSISKSKLGKMISDGTYYLSCWMTKAQIEEFKSRKVIFQNLN